MHEDARDSFFSHLAERSRRCPERAFLIDRAEEGDISYSWSDSLARIETIARSLSVLVREPRQNVAILSKNCAHWVMIDLGVIRAGHVSAPLFTTMTPDIFSYIMDFADIKVLFVGSADNWEAVQALVPQRVQVVCLPDTEAIDNTLPFDDFIALGEDQALPSLPDKDAPCSLIFTSGTTGKPKAVMHSLHSFYGGADIIKDCYGQHEGSRFVCYFPLAHIGERLLTVMHAILAGASITFISSGKDFLSDIRAVRPTSMLSVPRIWEKLLQGIITAFGNDPEALKAQLLGDNGKALAEKIKQQIGMDQVTFALTASAPTPQAIKDWFKLFGLILTDSYGQTEILPITWQEGEHSKPDSLGGAAPGCEFRIADDGEVLARGPGMALGYYNDPQKTAETFVDGWVRTGDKGHMDAEGNLYLTGRVQDTFKTAKGKYVAPVPIENRFSSSSLVEQQCLHGLGLTQPIMLCTLSESARSIGRDAIQQQLEAHVAKINNNLEPTARIGGVIISEAHWTSESGVLTHTMKVCRDRVQQAYQREIDSMAREIARDSRGIRFVCA